MLRESMIRNRKRASTLQEDWTQEVRLESNLGSGVLLPSLFEKKKKKKPDRRLSKTNLWNDADDDPHMRRKNTAT